MIRTSRRTRSHGDTCDRLPTRPTRRAYGALQACPRRLLLASVRCNQRWSDLQHLSVSLSSLQLVEPDFNREVAGSSPARPNIASPPERSGRSPPLSAYCRSADTTSPKSDRRTRDSTISATCSTSLSLMPSPTGIVSPPCDS